MRKKEIIANFNRVDEEKLELVDMVTQLDDKVNGVERCVESFYAELKNLSKRIESQAKETNTSVQNLRTEVFGEIDNFIQAIKDTEKEKFDNVDKEISELATKFTNFTTKEITKNKKTFDLENQKIIDVVHQDRKYTEVEVFALNEKLNTISKKVKELQEIITIQPLDISKNNISVKNIEEFIKLKKQKIEFLKAYPIKNNVSYNEYIETLEKINDCEKEVERLLIIKTKLEVEEAENKANKTKAKTEEKPVAKTKTTKAKVEAVAEVKVEEPKVKKTNK